MHVAWHYPQSESAAGFTSSAVPACQEVLPAGLVEYWHSLQGEGAEGPEYPAPPSNQLYAVINSALFGCIALGLWEGV